jgi:hypothetical protein
MGEAGALSGTVHLVRGYVNLHGPHFNAKTAAKEPQCEVVFTDLTVDEIGDLTVG